MLPAIACWGNNVYVAWYDQRNGLLDVFVNASTDGGVTWRASDSRVDTDLPGAANSILPRIACCGNRVYATWYDARSGMLDVYLNYSTDAGATWQASDIRLNTDPAGVASSMTPEIACMGSNVYVVWSSDRNTGWDVYLNTSTDGGATWLASDLRLDTDTAGADNSIMTQLACSGNRVFVVWMDERGGTGASSDIYFNSLK
jgi:hypothetical protein